MSALSLVAVSAREEVGDSELPPTRRATSREGSLERLGGSERDRCVQWGAPMAEGWGEVEEEEEMGETDRAGPDGRDRRPDSAWSLDSRDDDSRGATEVCGPLGKRCAAVRLRALSSDWLRLSKGPARPGGR